MAYIAARGDMHTYVERLHKVYGDVVRVGKFSVLVGDILLECLPWPPGPNELSFRDKDMVQPILSNKGVQKGPCE